MVSAIGYGLLECEHAGTVLIVAAPETEVGIESVLLKLWDNAYYCGPLLQAPDEER